MAEKLKDEADRRLESLFGSEPVVDDGFSVTVMQRVRRQVWIRRFSLPIALVIGGMFAAKPLLQLISALPEILAVVPKGVAGIELLSAGNLPQMSTVIMGAMLLGAAMMIGQMLED